MPLQQGQLLNFLGLVDTQVGEQLRLFSGHGRHAGDGLRPIQGCDSALLYAPLVVPIGLEQLHVTATSGVGELDKHAATITPEGTM